MDSGEESTRSVAARIRRNLGRPAPAERCPSLTLLASYPVAGLETVAQFAARAHISGPAIVRHVAKLGFVGYLDFQQALRHELELCLQPPSPTHRRNQALRYNGTSSSPIHTPSPTISRRPWPMF